MWLCPNLNYKLIFKLVYKKFSQEKDKQIFFKVLFLSRFFSTEFFPFSSATKYFKWGAAVALRFTHDDGALMPLAFWPDNIAHSPITSLPWDTLSLLKMENSSPEKCTLFDQALSNAWHESDSCKRTEQGSQNPVRYRGSGNRPEKNP